MEFMDIIKIVENRFKDYPLYSQENNKDPYVIVKLFDAYGSWTWYLTEYDQETKIAFWYVEWLFEDEWWYVSLIELSELRFHWPIPRIEVDLYFKSKRFSEIKLRE